MDKKKLREVTDSEVESHIESLRKELFLLRMKKSTGQLKTTHELKLVKRNIARAITIKCEKAGASD